MLCQQVAADVGLPILMLIRLESGVTVRHRETDDVSCVCLRASYDCMCAWWVPRGDGGMVTDGAGFCRQLVVLQA